MATTLTLKLQTNLYIPRVTAAFNKI